MNSPASRTRATLSVMALVVVVVVHLQARVSCRPQASNSPGLNQQTNLQNALSRTNTPPTANPANLQQLRPHLKQTNHANGPIESLADTRLPINVWEPSHTLPPNSMMAPETLHTKMLAVTTRPSNVVIDGDGDDNYNADLAAPAPFQWPADNPTMRKLMAKYFFVELMNKNFTTDSRSALAAIASGEPIEEGAELLADNRDLLALSSNTELITEPPSPSSTSSLSGGAKLDETLPAAAAVTPISPPSALPSDEGQAVPFAPPPAGGVSVNATPANARPATSPPSPPPAKRPFFGDYFYSFQTAYWPFHCVTCLVICAIGIFANLTNIIVLTRPNMITAVNTILCAIACSDLIVNISNIPYLLHLLSDASNVVAFYSYDWALYILMHAHVTVTAHTISIWLTCVLATWRYFVIRSQSPSQRNWSVSLAVRVILGVFLSVPVLCIPSYLSFDIITEQTVTNHTIYRVGFSHLAENSKLIKTFHFWMFSTLTKLLPCVMLAFFTIVLVRKLLSARERRLRLRNTGGSSSNSGNALPRNSCTIVREPNNNNHVDDRQTSAGKAVPNGSIKRGEPVRNDNNFRANSIEATELIVANGYVAASAAPNGCVAPTNESGALEPANQGRNLQQLARKESLRNALVVSRHLDSSDSGRQADDESNLKPTQASTMTPYSSSCATDADCLPASCNWSPTGSGDSQLDCAAVLGDAPSSLPPPPQAFGSMLVESNAGHSTGRHKTRIVAPESQEVQAITSFSLEPDELTTVVAAAAATSRSVSACGALELYAHLEDNQAGSDTAYRLTAVTPTPPVQTSAPAAGSASAQNGPPLQALGMTRPSLTVSAQDFARRNSVVQPEALGGARTSLSHSNLRPNGAINQQAAVAAAANRGRSTGSAASFAPFQIVRLQATQRQLNQNETTTRLLIAVMILFLVCEFPAGILSALCAILGQDFFDNVYQPMGALTDLFALINSSVNFILYCFMSTQFRVTFYRVVLRCPAPSAPPKGCNNNNNNNNNK